MNYPNKWSALDVAEYMVIKHHLEHFGWNMSAAARALKISYRFMTYKVKQYCALELMINPHKLNKKNSPIPTNNFGK
jgi:DNA-binding NtrC family response regulator